MFYAVSGGVVIDELDRCKAIGLAYEISCVVIFGFALASETVHVQFSPSLYLQAAECISWSYACILCSFRNKTVIAKVFNVAHSVGIPFEP